MAVERWQRLEELFDAARALPREDRAKYLTGATDDEGLRREALGMLEADAVSAEFLAVPALERLARSVAHQGWDLRPGDPIGAYTILRRLGAGGVGEVWRARDDRLRRDVAIKVLLPHVSGDAAGLRRFADEARATSALNHPNILTIHDVGERDGSPFLVSECLEGSNLRRLLDKSPLPTARAVGLALGVARGLAAAHARGIVHRDLKPENVFVAPDDGVKILDFGLATLRDGAPTDGGLGQALSGTIVGTAGYMAPEQIEGKPVDGRADLFALGVMLYEMLTGRHPFRGASTIETLHAVLASEPGDPRAENPRVPEALARIVQRLLAKRPEARFQSAIDLIWALEQPSAARVAAPEPAPRTRRAGWLAAAVAALAVLGAGWWLSRPAPAPGGTTARARFTLNLPAGVSLASVPAVSPDSKHIAWAGRTEDDARLYVHTLATGETAAVPATEGASQPFWSPDARSLAFFSRRQLKTMSWPGGAPVPIAEAPFAKGGSWTPAGEIVFAADVVEVGLSRVGASGGDVRPATVFDPSQGDTSHFWPIVLADGNHFLYQVRSARDERIGVYLGRLDRAASPPLTPLARSAGVAYVPLPGSADGVVLSVIDGRVTARRYDGAAAAIVGKAQDLGLTAGEPTILDTGNVSASPEVLAFAPAIPGGKRLVMVDRSGRALRLWETPETINWPRFSPDGRRLVLQRVDPVRNNPDLWIEDLERGTKTRVTTSPRPDLLGVWSLDGRQIAYASGSLPGRANGTTVLQIAAADGTGVQREISCPAAYCEPTDWSSDAKIIVVNTVDGASQDVWAIPLDSPTPARALLAESFTERDARLSPDGRWIAYVSTESGRPEVSVRSLAGRSDRIVLSPRGGDQPVWRRDGAELLFVEPSGSLQRIGVDWDADGTPRFGLPTPLDLPPIGFGHWSTQYDVTSDGQRLIVVRPNEDPAPREIEVVTGWRSLLGGT
jgi:Tol biopolymer transport system component